MLLLQQNLPASAVESCTFTVMDSEAVPSPVQDVWVGVYDATGTSLITAGYTNASGVFSTALSGSAGGTAYELRLAKTGVLFVSPQTISVLSPPISPNSWEFEGEVPGALPVATDPNFCRATGYFLDGSGSPLAGVVLEFRLAQDHTSRLPGMLATPGTPYGIVLGSGLAGSVVKQTTDSSGRVSVDLLRGENYWVTHSGSNQVGECLVPDSSFVNLVEMLYPYIVGVSFTPAVVSVAVGSSVAIAVVFTTSDGNTYSSDAPTMLEYESADVGVARVRTSGTGTIVVTGVATGTTTISVARISGTHVGRVGEVALSFTPIAVTVV